MHKLKTQSLSEQWSECDQLQKKPLSTFFKHVRVEKDKTHTHKHNELDRKSSTSFESCRRKNRLCSGMYLQAQKYAEVPGRNIFNGVNHVSPLGIQTATAVQGLCQGALQEQGTPAGYCCTE